MNENEDLMEIMDHSNDIFVMTERNNDSFIFVNNKACEILGYTKEELTSKPYYNFILKEDIEMTINNSNKLNYEKSVKNFINRYITKDNRILYLRWNYFEKNDKFYNFAKLEEDPERRILSEDNFTQFFKNSAIGICFVDVDGNFMESSGSLERILGYSKDELRKISFLDITHPEDVYEDLNNVQEIIDGKKNFYKINKRYIKKDGSIVFSVLHVIGIRKIDGGIAYFISQIEDITEMMKMKQDIERNNKILDNKNKSLESFAYAASHDLQEPLRKISAFSFIIKEKIEEYCKFCKNSINPAVNKDIYDDLSSLISASKRMGRLIDDLLEYSRVGRFDFKLEMVDMNEVVREVKELLSYSILEKNVNFQISDIPSLYSNKTRMIQLMQNLIGNAIKFSNKNSTPEIKIYVSKITDYDMTFCVEDNGIGFDMNYCEKIFRPFERLYGREDYEGSGMGLAFCKSIVDNLCGEIWAESEIGVGSKFFVTIPNKGENND